MELLLSQSVATNVVERLTIKWATLTTALIPVAISAYGQARADSSMLVRSARQTLCG